jgi:hypothetical protein
VEYDVRRGLGRLLPVLRQILGVEVESLFSR